jgi:hypothetical protein
MTQPANTLTYSTFTVRANCSAQFSGVLTDEDGETPIPSGTLNSLTLTLKDKAGNVINDRDGQDVLNANGVTVDAVTGELVWSMSPVDNALSGTVADGAYEDHFATFVWTWAAGAKRGARRVNIRVQKLDGA